MPLSGTPLAKAEACEIPPLHHIVLILDVALTLATVLQNSNAGYWPGATYRIIEISGQIGPFAAAATAWDTSRKSISYLRAASSSWPRTVWSIAGRPVSWILFCYVVMVAIICIDVLRAPTDGGPWWQVLLSSGVWMTFCAITGVVIGHLMKKTILATLIAFGISVLWAVVSLARRTTAIAPRFHFLPGRTFEDDIINHQPVTWVVLLSTLTVVLIMGIALAVLAGVLRRTGIAVIATVAVLVTGTLSTGFTSDGITTIGTEPRSTEDSGSYCTKEVNGAQFCSWPDDKHVVEKTDDHWEDFVTTLDWLGISVPAGTWGQTGSGHEREIFVAYNRSSVYEGIFSSISFQQDFHNCDYADLEYSPVKLLDAWAIYAFREKDDTIPTYFGSIQDEERFKWVINISNLPLIEQEKELAPFADAIHQCLAQNKEQG